MSEFSVGRRSRYVEVHEGVTDGSGLAVITYNKEFAELPMIAVDMVSPATPRMVWDKVSETATGCTIRIRQPVTVNVALVGLVLSASLETVPAQQFRAMVMEC